MPLAIGETCSRQQREEEEGQSRHHHHKLFYYTRDSRCLHECDATGKWEELPPPPQVLVPLAIGETLRGKGDDRHHTHTLYTEQGYYKAARDSQCLHGRDAVGNDVDDAAGAGNDGDDDVEDGDQEDQADDWGGTRANGAL